MSGKEGHQEFLFEEGDKYDSLRVCVVKDLSVRENPVLRRIGDLDDKKKYRAAIVMGRRVVQSIGAVEKERLGAAASGYFEFKIGDNEVTNLWVQDQNGSV